MIHTGPSCGVAFALAFFLLAPAQADVPSFITTDPRLPNPDHPYDMATGTVQFPQAHDFGLYDLRFQPTNSSQLDILSRNKDGNWSFESIFDIAYEAQISFGLGPVYGVKGTGKAHMRGEEVYSPAAIDNQAIYLDTELVALDLFGLSSDAAFLFRESSLLRSSGVTIVEDACPACARPMPIYRISSHVDVYAEASADGGQTWAAGDRLFRIVQQANPVVLGDYNENGAVDAADYVVWRNRLGPGSLANEAGISPRFVDEADIAYWRSRFGARAVFQSTLASSVPEPASLVLSLVTILLLLVRRCGR